MVPIAGLCAVLLGAQAGGIAPQTVTQEDHQRLVRQLHDSVQEQMQMRSALNAARLQQMAMVVRFTTQNGSRLGLGSGVSANPRMGRIPMTMGRGNTPFITVYPTLSPRKVTLNGVGECELLGAVNVQEGARNHGEKLHCEPGVYLLALRNTAKGVASVSLLDVHVDARGDIQYREALKVPAVEQNTPDEARTAPVTVAFPGRGEASEEQPAWHVGIEMPSQHGSVRFGFDMDITML